MAKMAIWVNTYSTRGRNRAPFRSTIDGCRDNGNRSFNPGGHLGFFKSSQNGNLGKHPLSQAVGAVQDMSWRPVHAWEIRYGLCYILCMYKKHKIINNVHLKKIMWSDWKWNNVIFKSINLTLAFLVPSEWVVENHYRDIRQRPNAVGADVCMLWCENRPGEDGGIQGIE